MQEFEYLKIYDVISNLKDEELKKKFETFIEFIIQSNQTHKTKWHLATQGNSYNLSKKKMNLYKDKAIADSKKLKTLEDYLETESYFTMETLGKTKVEFEFLLNIIISLSFETVPKMMRRLVKGNYDGTGIKFKKYLKDGRIKKIILELYSEKHLEYHKMEKEDRDFIMEVYKFEQEFIFDFLDFIERYLGFLEKARNNMYHNFTFATPRNDGKTMYPEKYIKGSLPLFVFNIEENYFERYEAGKEIIKDYTLMMGMCVVLAKIPLHQYMRAIERDQRVINIIASPEGKKRIKKYSEILAKYGFPQKGFEDKSMLEEISKSKERKNVKTQRKMHEDFKIFLEKYPPTQRKREVNI